MAPVFSVSLAMRVNLHTVREFLLAPDWTKFVLNEMN